MTVLAVASAVFYTSQLPANHVAESRVLVGVIDPVEEEAVSPVAGPNMATEQEIAGSPEVVRRVRERLSADVSANELREGLAIENPPETEILVLSYTDPDPAFARSAAQAFAEEYVKLRRRGAALSQLGSAQEIEERIAALAQELQRIDSEIRTESDDAVVASLISRADLLTGLLVQRRQELQSLRQDTLEVAEVFQPAVVLGRAPAGYSRNVVVALLLGLMLGVAQAALRGRLDDRLRSVEQAEQYLRSSALALVPPLSQLDQKGTVSSLSSRTPSAISDAFVPLRVSFVAAASRREARSVLLTSSSSGEGRSTIAAHLAITLALMGRKVTVICADPERHRLEHMLGAPADTGLAQVLDGSVPLGQALLPSVVRNLTLLPCGRPAGGNVELSGSGSVEALFDSLRERAGFVLVDAPPLGDPDAVSLLPLVDAVALVVDCRHMHARRLTIARRQLDRANADVLGVVFNQATPSVVSATPSFVGTTGSSASELGSRWSRLPERRS